MNSHFANPRFIVKPSLSLSIHWINLCHHKQQVFALHMLTVIHSPKIQGLIMMSTLSFLILLHANVNPSTDKVWEVIKVITTNTMFTTMILLLKLNFVNDFALIWWNELATLGLQPHTCDGLKIALCQRFVPPSYQCDLCKKLQRLDQGGMSVQDYYTELQKGMIRAEVHEETEDKICHFYGGL
jgi:hypothetical protein